MTPSETAAPLRVVLYDGPGSRRLAVDRKFALLQALLKNGYQVTCTGSVGTVASADSSHLVVLSEVDDGVDGSASIFSDQLAQGTNGGDVVDVSFCDISGSDPDAVVASVESVRDQENAYSSGEWKPWFPVIDYKRCTNCMQCLSFCLFDVYGVDEEQNIDVKNPDKCKTNCPACSRVCPDVAILFPKYGSGPINGDEVKEEDVEREKMKVDISALLGGDIYSMLRERHSRAQTRFSKERDESRALKERARCLKKLQEGLDIPEEVLMSLPSLEEIQRKAKQAGGETD